MYKIGSNRKQDWRVLSRLWLAGALLVASGAFEAVAGEMLSISADPPPPPLAALADRVALREKALPVTLPVWQPSESRRLVILLFIST